MSATSSQWGKIFRWLAPKMTVLDSAAVTSVGTEQDVSQWGWVGVAVVTNGFTGTLKFQGSFEKIADIDFTASASKSNPWGFVDAYKYDGSTQVVGSTGLTFAADSAVYLLTMNETEMRSLCAKITRTVGDITVYFYPANNQ